MDVRHRARREFALRASTMKAPKIRILTITMERVRSKYRKNGEAIVSGIAITAIPGSYRHPRAQAMSRKPTAPYVGEVKKASKTAALVAPKQVAVRKLGRPIRPLEAKEAMSDCMFAKEPKN
jgi:hypothetical protein